MAIPLIGGRIRRISVVGTGVTTRIRWIPTLGARVGARIRWITQIGGGIHLMAIPSRWFSRGRWRISIGVRVRIASAVAGRCLIEVLLVGVHPLPVYVRNARRLESWKDRPLLRRILSVAVFPNWRTPGCTPRGERRKEMHGGNHVAIRRLMGGIVENVKAVFLDSSFIILSHFALSLNKRRVLN